ncbi:probable transcription factor At3g04930 [Brassica napus]|uniref:probable transcription factor At3g04930 n=1 Tax=Brassica napus TaxID=3708 RepID=UPI002078674B|nr:probable transcription factor At3g04930 [Brassica napus]
MTSDHRVFSIESPDHEGGESDTDDDVALPETNDDLNSPSNVTVALPSGSSAVPVSVIPADSSPKLHHRTTEIFHRRQQQPPPPPAIDDSRRLFQRLWTDEDEIELLRGFLDYVTTHRGGSNPPDTAPFYEMIKSKLQLEFNKNQLVEKLRRLKKKYRNVMSKFGSGKEVLFKSPHDQSTFEISRKIWNRTGKIIGFEMDFEVNGNSPGSNPSAAVEIESENGVEKKGSRKRSRSRIGKIEEDNNVNVNVNETVSSSIGGLIEETVRSCVSPLIKEMMNGTTSMMMAGSLGPVFTRPLGYGVEGGGGGSKAVRDERWRKQQILELEVYSRRLELVQEEIRATLHELKTMPSGV